MSNLLDAGRLKELRDRWPDDPRHDDPCCDSDGEPCVVRELLTHIDTQANQILELRLIVDNGLKTRDGVTIKIGMTVWFRNSADGSLGSGEVEDVTFAFGSIRVKIKNADNMGWICLVQIDCLYSIRETLEAAGQE